MQDNLNVLLVQRALTAQLKAQLHSLVKLVLTQLRMEQQLALTVTQAIIVQLAQLILLLVLQALIVM